MGTVPTIAHLCFGLSRKIEKELPYAKYINNPEIEKLRPKMGDFKDDPDYEENKKKLERQEEKIKEEWGKRIHTLGPKKAKELEESEKRSKILEGFLALEGKKIFGEDAEIIPSSRFDDVFNKIDLVLEIKEEGKIIRFGIDASVSDDPKVIDDKTNKINQERIKNDKTNIRYFKSVLKPNLMEKLENVPRVSFILSNKNWDIILGTMKNETNEKFLLIQNKFINFIKPQLENQFLYVLSQNIQELKTFIKKTGRRPRKIHQTIADKLYSQAKEIRLGKWGNMPKLLRFFEENENVFKYESIIHPRLFELLKNIKEALTWLYEKEEENKQSMFIFFGGDVKEKTALLKAVTIEHWDPKIFEGI